MRKLSAFRPLGRGLAVLAAAALGLTVFGGTTEAEEKIVLMTWGGSWLDLTREHIIEPFEKETGIKVEVRVHDNTLDGLAKLRAIRDNMDVDVWATSPVPALLAQEEGLSLPIPRDKLTNAQYLPDALVTSEWVAWYQFFFGVVYDESKVPFKITEWKQLWDPQLKGQLAVPHASNAEGKFIALLTWLGGGDEANADPGFSLAKELRPNVGAYYEVYTQRNKYFEAGEVSVMSFVMVGEYLSLAEGHPNFKFVAPDPFVAADVDCFALIKGKNQEGAIKFINYAIGKAAQEGFAEPAVVVPVNRLAAIPAALKEYAPDESKYRYPNTPLVKEKLPGWVERWNQEVQVQ